MNILAKKISQFLAAEDGPTVVEFAVLLAIGAIVCLAAIASLNNGRNGG